MTYPSSDLTRVQIVLDHLTDNMRLLQELAGHRPLWPVIKANAYGHGADIVGRHLVQLGYKTLCVAQLSEAMELRQAGVNATVIVLSATLPENSEYFVAYGFEPVVCTLDMIEALGHAASRAARRVSVHLKVDTGMGRIGIEAGQVAGFLEKCRDFPGVVVKGLMSHFPRADEAEKSVSGRQIEVFRQLQKVSREYGVEIASLANSAAIFDLPDAGFDAARPGIAIYGLKPSRTMLNPRVNELKPVLELTTRITYLKEVPAGSGVSYGHTFQTTVPSLLATIPLGYGDGISRVLSNQIDVLVGGKRCRQVGQICMDQSVIDVTALRGQVALGDEVVVIGRQGTESISADEHAEKLGTINYEIVTRIAKRAPRVAVPSRRHKVVRRLPTTAVAS